MTIRFSCICGTNLKAPDNFEKKRAECPMCGKLIEVPKSFEESAEATKAEGFVDSIQQKIEQDFSHEILEYIDPPGEDAAPAEPSEPKPTILFRMFEALLDPRSIQWMLLLGGALAVIGLLVWLISMGIFENTIVVAVFLGLGTLAILGTGWWMTLKTQFKVAGHAITFLGCVVMPLNLWFYHAQDLISITEHLWLGGVVCCLFYFATVKILKEPKFLYAAEAGITMTVLLLLADMGKLTDSTHFSLYMVILGFISIHVERLFAKDSTETPTEYTSEKYGMPFFWSGHIQITIALVFLFLCQGFTWGMEIISQFPLAIREVNEAWGWQKLTISITENSFLACGLWLVGIYTSLYSYLIVKKIRWGMSFAGFCLVMAEVTLFNALNLEQEGIIAFLAGTALVLHLINHFVLGEKKELENPITIMSIGLSCFAVVWALLLHLGAINSEYGNFPNVYDFKWGYVVATLFAAVSSRTLQVLTLKIQPRISATYFFLSAASLMLAASATLHMFAWDQWSQRAMLLILVPIGYLIASRLWRGKFPEIPLYWVAHVGTAAVLLHVFWASLLQGQSILYVRQGDSISLYLGILFLEAVLFYGLATWFRRRGINIYFAVASLCGAVWQFSGYLNVDPDWYVVLYSALGIGSLVASRFIGVKEEIRFDNNGVSKKVIRGSGLPFYQSGNALLLVSMISASIHAIGDVNTSYANAGGQFVGWLPLLSLVFTILAGLIGLMLVFNGVWKNVYILGTIILAAQSFILINVLIDLSNWQKLEIFSSVVGLAILVASYIGLFREEDQEKPDDATVGSETIGFGLFIGSLLSIVPVLCATFYFHLYKDNVFTLDDFFLITVGVIMLVTGFSWKVKSTTLISGASLFIYLVMIIAIIAYNPQVAVGVYLGIGGLLLFGTAVLLSIYRERLLQIPDRITNREGVFSIINWR